MPDPHPPQCKECGCRTGGGEYCFNHAPYTVYPLKDGSFRSTRHGLRHIWLGEPPHPTQEFQDSLHALIAQWRAQAKGLEGHPPAYARSNNPEYADALRQCATDLAARLGGQG